MYLGLEATDETALVEELRERGWGWEEGQRVLLPKVSADSEGKAAREAGDSMSRLVGLVGFLGE